MPTEVYWATLPPALVAACVLLLTSKRSTQVPLSAVRKWLDAVGPALAIASGYVVGHWGVAGLRWALAEALVPWLVVGAVVVELVGMVVAAAVLPSKASALPSKARALAGLLRPVICGVAAEAVLRGAAVVEQRVAWVVSLGLIFFVVWSLLRVGSQTNPDRLRAWPPVIATVALSLVLLFAGSLKLALLAAALASALGAMAVVGCFRLSSFASAQGPIALAYLALLANGYFFAELKPGAAALLVIALVLPAQVRVRTRWPSWVALLAALIPAAIAVATSWSPPGE